MRPSLLFCTAALASTLGLGCSEPAPTDPSAPAAAEPSSLKKASAPTPQLLVTGFHEFQGSTVGPGGALFVTAPLTGRIWRVDPETGAVTLFASGLPPRIPDFFFTGSGVVDVAFLDGTAYALVAHCYQRGLRVPDDLAVVGFDGCHSPHEIVRPLTTVRAPWAQVAWTAVQHLVSLMNGETVPQETVLPVEFLPGQTG